MIEATDRYGALGITPNGCEGQCEGTGVVPVHRDNERDPRLFRLWMEAEVERTSEDGYHFVPCPDCNPEARKHPTLACAWCGHLLAHHGDKGKEPFESFDCVYHDSEGPCACPAYQVKGDMMARNVEPEPETGDRHPFGSR